MESCPVGYIVRNKHNRSFAPHSLFFLPNSLLVCLRFFFICVCPRSYALSCEIEGLGDSSPTSPKPRKSMVKRLSL